MYKDFCRLYSSAYFGRLTTRPDLVVVTGIDIVSAVVVGLGSADEGGGGRSG